MEPVTIIYSIVILIMSVVIHEVAHGAMANALGDPTAKLQGRLTLNPIRHLDPFGSVILPTILILSNSPFLLGWAKPVPYNPYGLTKGGKYAEALVASAGIFANFVLAITFAFIFRLGLIPSIATEPAFYIVLINILLGFFNLIPVPPLDGSKILYTLLPLPIQQKIKPLYHNQMLPVVFIILFLFVFGNIFVNFTFKIASFLIGS